MRHSDGPARGGRPQAGGTTTRCVDSTTDPLDRVLSRLEGVAESGDQWAALCPAHDDTAPSLSVGQGHEGRVLVHCHAGCTVESIVLALGLEMRDLYRDAPDRFARQERRWPIVDAEGHTVAVHVRRDLPDGAKRVHWEQPDGARGLGGVRMGDLPLYGLRRLLAAPADGPVVLAEGEKATDALQEAGVLAVGTVTGASGTPSHESLRVLLGRSVILWPDADEPGRGHMTRIARRLRALEVESIRWVEVAGATGGDDAADISPRRVREAVEAARPWDAAEAAQADEGRDADDVVVTCLADVVPEPVQWLWSGWIARRKVTLIAGDPGLGKSYMTLDLAARVSSGREWPDGTRCERGSVVLLSAEDDLADTIRPRLDAAGADCSGVHALEGRRDPHTGRILPVTLEDLDPLRAAIEKTADCRLVIVDPVSAYMGDADSHVMAEVRAVMAELARLAQEKGVAVVVVAHLRKQAGPAAHLVAGSGAFVAAARAVYHVIRDPEDDSGQTRLLATVKANLSRDRRGYTYRLEGDPCAVKWLEDRTDVDLDELLRQREKRRVRSSPAVAEAEQWLRGELAGGPRPAREIQSAARTRGISDRSLQRAREAIRAVSKRQGFPARAVWELPQATPANLPDWFYETEEIRS